MLNDIHQESQGVAGQNGSALLARTLIILWRAAVKLVDVGAQSAVEIEVVFDVIQEAWRPVLQLCHDRLVLLHHLNPPFLAEEAVDKVRERVETLVGLVELIALTFSKGLELLVHSFVFNLEML